MKFYLSATFLSFKNLFQLEWLLLYILYVACQPFFLLGHLNSNCAAPALKINKHNMYTNYECPQKYYT